ncbi:MAG: hypothetical protein ACE14L_17450 [Terriglobales bacterium]
MNDFEKQVLSDLAELKTQMRALLGNGSPGRMRQLEERVERHEQFVQRSGGIGAALATLLTLVHVAIDWLRIK